MATGNDLGLGYLGKVPSNTDLRKYANENVNSAYKTDQLAKKIFPTWNGYTAKIFEKVLKHGKNSKEVSLSELINLYPGAMKMGMEVEYNGNGGKQLFIQHIEEFLKREMMVEDMMTFSRIFSIEVSKKLQENKEEIRAEFSPRISALEKGQRRLETENAKLKEIIKKKPIYDRELILFDPEDLDLNKTDDDYDPKNVVLGILGKHYDNKLPIGAIKSVKKIEKSKTGQERFAVIMANQQQRDIICFNAENDPVDKEKIKRGIPPHERAEKVKLYPFKVAAAQFNFESQVNKQLVFYRAEIDPITGEVGIKKYHSKQPQVSATVAKAKEGKLTAHPHFKDEDHRKLFPSS